MADYLTLLARRSLGDVTSVKPVRRHPFAETRSSGGGPVEEEVLGGTSSGPMIDNGSKGRDGRGSTMPATGSSPEPTPSPPPIEGETMPVSPIAPEAVSGPVRRWVEPDPEAGAGDAVPDGRDRRPAEPGAPTGRDRVEDPDLLLPDHMDRRRANRGESRREGVGADAEGTRPATEEALSPTPSDGAAGRHPLPQVTPDANADVGGRSGHPTVEVSIGTIEIRAVTPKPPVAIPRARRVRPELGLDDYLEQRRRGER